MDQRLLHSNNTSGYKGVYWKTQRQKYVAQLRLSGRNYHLGYFGNPIDAAKAYDAKAKELFGEFAYRFVEGDLKTLIQSKFGAIYHRLIGGLLAGLFLFMTIFTMSLGYFRPSQPQKIKMLPIVNFLNQDQHDQLHNKTGMQHKLNDGHVLVH